MYDIKALYEASSVAEAVQLLTEHPTATIIAGGSDVLVKMREGALAGAELVSIYMIDALRGVSMDDDGTIRIGSLTSFSSLEKDPIIQKYIPVLGEAAGFVGSPQIRAIGTIGGNTCNGVTSADTASTVQALEAIVELTGPEGVRLVPIKDFYIKAKVVDIRPSELQTAILIPKASYENCFGHYIKYAMRNALDIATTGCSVNVRLSEDKKTFDRVRVGFGVTAPIPMRALKAEAFINSKAVTEDNIKAFASAVLEDITPRDSWRASKEFRQHAAVVMAERAIKKSIMMAGGTIA